MEREEVQVQVIRYRMNAERASLLPDGCADDGGEAGTAMAIPFSHGRVAREREHSVAEIRAELWRCGRSSGNGSAALSCLSRLKRRSSIEERNARVVCRDDYVACLKSLSRDKRWRASLRVLAEAKRERLADSYMYCAVVAACGRAGEWERAVQLLDEAEERGCSDIAVYNAALHACAQERRLEETLLVFQRLTATVGTPDVISYAAIVGTCASCAQWGMAAELADDMVRTCVGVGVVPAANILLAVRKQRAWHRSLMSVVPKEEIVAFEASRGWDGDERFRIANRIALALDGTGDDALRSSGPGDAFVACARRGEWDLLECIAHQCIALGKPIEMDSIRLAIHSMNGMEETAMLMSTLRSTSRGGRETTEAAFDPVLLSCELASKTAKSGLPDDALQIMHSVIEDRQNGSDGTGERVTVPSGPFNCIIRSFAARGDHESACETMRTMHGAGIAWNRGTVHAALESILHCRDGDLAELAFEQSTGQARTPAVRKVVAETLSLCGREGDARRVLEDEHQTRRN